MIVNIAAHLASCGSQSPRRWRRWNCRRLCEPCETCGGSARTEGSVGLEVLGRPRPPHRFHPAVTDEASLTELALSLPVKTNEIIKKLVQLK